MYIKTEKNKGPGAARNLGVKNADTEWVAFNDSDDLWHEDKLKKQFEYIEAHPEFDLVYCGYRAILHNESVVSVPSRNELEKLEGSIYYALLEQNYIGAPTVVVNREKFLCMGDFNEEFQCLEDWDFAVRFAKNYKIGFVNEDLMDVKLRSGGVSSKAGNYFEARCKIVKVILTS